MSLSRGCEIAKDLSNDAGELEAVTGKSGSEDYLRIIGMPVDDEVFVRSHRVHASGCVRHLSIQGRDSISNGRADCLFISGMDDPVD